ncbi:MAG: class I SAM-dependent methyltransferase [Oscillospiraceae bacterium]|nr:class I SAM-dependent methyltransferase [Oscillospiraceae bacterium]
MNSVNKTLYIPLYGKALVSRQGIILEDKTAERIWDAVQFPLKAKSRSKWLAYYMSMRAKVFDDWLDNKIAAFPEAAVLHLGCGLDSRNLRVAAPASMWYDVDFPQVIEERKKYFREEDHYHMISADVTDPELLLQIPSAETALIVMEGISMYLNPEDLSALLHKLARHFGQVHILMDCYTEFAAKMSKYKNPVNDVGVTQVYGMDDPATLAERAGIAYCKESEMTPRHLILQLPKRDQRIFRTLYAGSMSKRLYRLYAFQSK